MFGVTAAMTARAFLVGQLGFLRSRGWTVHLVTGEEGLADFAAAEGGVTLHHVPTAREPSPGDLASVVRLWWLLRRSRPATVVMGTPKMGVLGTVAAFLARVPDRIYLVHGYRAEGVTGWRGRLLRLLDRLACSFATIVVPVSPSLRRKLISERIVAAKKAVVLGSGSANGVDVERFKVPSADVVRQSRSALGLPDDAKVVAFVGRLTRDKGLRDLVALWPRVAEGHPEYWLVVAGADESVDETDRAALADLDRAPRVVRLPHIDRIEHVYQAADVLLMLSRREGLGMVVIEAAATGVPAVAFAATGVVDSIVDGETGYLCPGDDLESVRDRLVALLADDELRRALGSSARLRASEKFERRVVWESWLTLFERRVASSYEPTTNTEVSP